MIKSLKPQLLASIFSLLLLILACNLPQAVTTPDLANIVAKTQTAAVVRQYLTPKATGEIIPPTSSTEQIPTEATSIWTSTTPPEFPIQPTISSTPEPSSSQQSGCINIARFIDETVTDNTIFNPGQEFVKTWMLQNVGTCTWTPDYELVFVRGERMEGTSPALIGQTVNPEASIRLSLPLIAPRTSGEFQGFWMLRSPSGQEFGLGKSAEVPFWVKIKVQTGAAVSGSELDPNLVNTLLWRDSFEDKKSRMYLGGDDELDFRIKDGNLIMTALKPIGDQWRVFGSNQFADFLLRATFTPSANCTGKDGYGFIVRAPAKPNGIINSGYVFSFSCDGQFRVYLMKNGVYSNLQNWSRSPAILAGGGKSNQMDIYAKGAALSLYANGVSIYSFQDGEYSGGLIGPLIRSESSGGFHVSIDEVSIWSVR